jgi:chromate transporter
VAVVAQAVWGMGVKLCPGRTRITLALAAAALLLVVPGALGQIGVIVAGSVIGWWLYRRELPSASITGARLARHHVWAAATLVAFLALLLVLPAVAVIGDNKSLTVFDAFYRAGSLVFGGGHVVLPLLRAEVVPPGWITDDAFLAGYGAAQALPGPLFTFSAYLGTIIQTGPNGWTGGLWCLCAILLPAWMLIGGALPFWDLLRSRGGTQAALRGANAAVVGVLLAALYNPVWREGVTGARDVAAGLAAFALLQFWKTPPWLVVGLMAALGQWAL